MIFLKCWIIFTLLEGFKSSLSKGENIPFENSFTQNGENQDSKSKFPPGELPINSGRKTFSKLRETKLPNFKTISIVYFITLCGK